MAKTFQQICNDVRSDMRADGIYDMADASLYYDLAESMLHDPEFLALAKKRFPQAKSKQLLQECVADCLYC